MIRQALRANPWSFLGPFTTQLLAAALVAAGLGITTSFDRAPLDAAARQALTDSGLTEIAIIFVMIAIIAGFQYLIGERRLRRETRVAGARNRLPISLQEKTG